MSSIKQLEWQVRDWKTKYENLVIQKEISDAAFKEEIASLKKELVEKDKWIEYLSGIIEKLDAKVDGLTAQVAALSKENAELKATIAIQNDQILNLKARLNKDSDNSSKPSSTNGFKKVIQNNRVKTGKKIGGQPGHKGHYLKYFSNPTEIVEKKLSICNVCNGEVLHPSKYCSKQLVDLEINLKVKEERVFTGYCCQCGKKHTDAFSNEYVNPVQYGDNIKTLCGYDEKRSSKAISGMGILEYFTGILMHDHFSSYYKNSLATHAECNAHILRYLKSITEIFKHNLAKEMTEHLVDCLNRKKACLVANKKSFGIHEIYDHILNFFKGCNLIFE